MSVRRLLLVLGGFLVGAAAAVMILNHPGPGGGNGNVVTTSGKALIGGPFRLTDSGGNEVTEKDFAGRPMLVYFGFTNCPDICPSGLQIISAALDKLGPAGKDLVPIFVTLDPERDTPEVMGAYVKSFHPRIVGLTGTQDEIAAVAKAYRVYYARVADAGSAGNYSIDHSGFMYLMDRSGQFTQHFPHSVTVEKLAEALPKVM